MTFTGASLLVAQHFADDTTVLYKCRSLKKMRLSLSKEISLIYDWLCANRLSLNESKTDLILFRPRHKPCEVRLTLRVKNKKISLSTEVKFLGVILDQHLTWKLHIAELSKKLTKANGLLSKIRHYIDVSTLKTIYYNLFHSHMTYACMTWGFGGKNKIKHIYTLY